MKTILKILKKVVKNTEQSLIDDFDYINDSDWIDSWETHTDQGSIAFDIGYINGVRYAVRLLNEHKTTTEMTLAKQYLELDRGSLKEVDRCMKVSNDFDRQSFAGDGEGRLKGEN